MITLLDYGMGNLRSVEKALARVGAEVTRTREPADVERAESLIVPGVGAFGQAMERLTALGLDAAIRRCVDRGGRYLGICLGMQLLFETSEEHGRHRGLGLLPGAVVRLPDGRKVPQVGWNQAAPAFPDPLFEGIPGEQYFYFDQSYYCRPAEPSQVLARTEYGISYASAVRHGRIAAVQFHPEKSQRWGLALLRNFAGAA